MAGTLTISTLKNDTGVLSVQNGMTGIAKAWVNFVGSTAVINGSFNVSSVTRNSIGNYTVTFTTAMPSANYVFTVTPFDTGTNPTNGCSASLITNTTSAVNFTVGKYSAGYYDPPTLMVGILSA